jgi:hypothetical protein
MSSIIKLAAKIINEISQQNEKNDAKQDECNTKKVRLGEVVKEK